MLGRQTPWKPSQPAITSHSSSSSRPSCRYRISGRSVSSVVHRDVRDLEVKGQTRLEAKADQVLDELGLAVDHDRAPVGEVAQRDPVALARELELDPVVDEPLALQPLARAGLHEEVDDRLLDDPGTDARLDVLATPVFEDHRVDALELEEVAERESGRTCADDAHLRARFGSAASLLSSRTRWAIANAPLAAGTPQ